MSLRSGIDTCLELEYPVYKQLHQDTEDAYYEWQAELHHYHWLFMGGPWPPEVMTLVEMLERDFHQVLVRFQAQEAIVLPMITLYNSLLHQERLRCIAEQTA